MKFSAEYQEPTLQQFTSALNGIWHALADDRTLESRLTEILASLNSLLPFNSASVLLVKGKDLVFKAAIGLENMEKLVGRIYPQNEYKLTSRCIEQNTPIIIDDVHKNPDWKLNVPSINVLPIRSWMGIPLRMQAKVIGVLCLDSHTPGYFNPAMLPPVLSFAEQAAMVIWHASLTQDVRNRANETEVLLQISRELSSTLDLDTVLHTITAKALEILSKNTTAVYLLDKERKYLSVASACGIEAAIISRRRIKPGSGIVGSVVCTGKSEIINATGRDPRAVHIEGTAPDDDDEKLMALPLILRDTILGVMVIWRGSDEAPFDDHDLAFCTALASQAALAIYNAQLYGQAQSAREEAEDANRTKTRFLATMSHELRTPLNSIINFAYLLHQQAEGPVNSAQADFLGRIENSGRHLLSLINDILDMAKIEAGKMELFLEDFYPDQLLTEVIQLAIGLAADKNLAIKLSSEPDLPAIRADRTRLKQILLNLLGNAVKFTDSGYVKLAVHAGSKVLEFRIEDSGRGISKENIPLIFKEFSCLELGDRTSGEGTGLGLSITKHLVELHQGTIHLDSTLGKGTSIGFTIPRATPQPNLDQRS